MKAKSIFACVLFILGLALVEAQQNPTDQTKAISKTTDTGFEVSVLSSNIVRDRDALNNVMLYRYGSCPPGAVLADMKVSANAGNDVIVVRLGIKVLPAHRGGALSVPVLMDSADKKYSSRNTMLSDSLKTLLARLKGSSEQLECEFPFEIPKGIRINKLQFEGVSLDIKLEEHSTDRR